MTRRKSQGLAPFPQAGDYVLIGHGIYYDPDRWWITHVEWTDGEQFIARYTAGWHPSHAPEFYKPDAVIVHGTREHCELTLRAALDAYRDHLPAIRAANVAVAQAKDACVAAVRAAVEAAPAAASLESAAL